jgi:hypothetical protein
MSYELETDHLSIDVAMILKELNSTPNPHLVTRTTGRDVRSVIEVRLSAISDKVISLIDFSDIEVMDFSCADEVVARLLTRFIGSDRPQEAFFVLKGLVPNHLEPVAEVLERQGILAVAENCSGLLELLGNSSSEEGKVWGFIEEKRSVTVDELNAVFMEKDDQEALKRLIDQRVVFYETTGNKYRSFGSVIDSLLE